MRCNSKDYPITVWTGHWIQGNPDGEGYVSSSTTDGVQTLVQRKSWRIVHLSWNTWWSNADPSTLHLLSWMLYGNHKEQPQFVGTWTQQGVKSVPQGCWPMLTPMLPTVVSSWLDVLSVVDHSWYTWETVECENPRRVAVIDANRCGWHLLQYPVQKHLHFLSWHSPSEWYIYTIHVSVVSRLKCPSYGCRGSIE